MQAQLDIVKVPQMYATQKELCGLFSLSRAHMYNLVQGMKKTPKYKKYVISYSKVVRIKISAFEEYWREYATKH